MTNMLPGRPTVNAGKRPLRKIKETDVSDFFLSLSKTAEMLHPATSYASIQSHCRDNEHFGSFSLTLVFSKQKKNGRINEKQGGKVRHRRYSDTPIMHRRQGKHLITSLYKMSGIPRTRSGPMATKRLPFIHSRLATTAQFCMFSWLDVWMEL